MNEFTFQGIRPYIRRSAEGYEGMDPALIGRAERIDGVTRAGDALTQACHARPEDRHAIAFEAERQRDVLALALEGVEAAILDVYAHLELPAPQFAGGTEQPPAPPEQPAPAPQTANPKRPLDTSSLAPQHQPSTAAPAPVPAQEEAPKAEESQDTKPPGRHGDDKPAPAGAPKAAPSAPSPLKDEDEPPLRSSRKR